MIPNPIRMYAPIADLDLMMPPPQCSGGISNQVNHILSKQRKNSTKIFPTPFSPKACKRNRQIDNHNIHAILMQK